jgi:SAM-dependent methyltransferase
MVRYVHGYSARETERLYDQASSVRELIHHDTAYPTGALVLEAACGVGAQTVTLVHQSPGARFVSFDIALDSLLKARALAREERLEGVTFLQADLFALPFAEGAFDHLFVCYVLEHLADPLGGLRALGRMVKPGGTITVIEGDHGSCYFHPQTPESLHAWNCLIQAQARLGGNSLIGRELYPLLVRAGFREVCVSPRMVYADASRPALMESFVGKTITPMVEGARPQALALGLTDAAPFDAGVEHLLALAQNPEGTFCYTFFKALAMR